MTTYDPSNPCVPVDDQSVKDVEGVEQAPANHPTCRDRARKRSGSRKKHQKPSSKIRRDFPQHPGCAVSDANGMLAMNSPVVRQRLLSEGVPEDAVHLVATELGLCISAARGRGHGFVAVSNWTAGIVSRYGGKLPSLFMKTRGRVTAR